MLPKGYEKKSFLRFEIQLDMDVLRKEFNTIKESEWMASYWGNIHCSVGMLLLRGGSSNTEKDFFCDEVSNTKILEKLPYIKHLISDSGPFGKVEFAFIFKTKPDGVTLIHQDLMEKWKDLYRVHVPIYTNPGAYLISDGYSQHYEEGFAWLFDNHTDHGVVNGATERVHLIIDVKLNKKTKLLIDNATYFKGQVIESNNDAIRQKNKEIPSYYGDVIINDAIEKLRGGNISDSNIAQYFNSKNIPCKKYLDKYWNEKMIKTISKL